MNIGFLGCSKIGARIVEALKENKDAVLYGCAAQDSKRAEELKSEIIKERDVTLEEFGKELQNVK